MNDQLVSVQRIYDYLELPKEADLVREADKDRKDWPPKDGAIRFKGVYMRYRSDTEFAIKRLSFALQPRAKVGIVGRTGAGKSSIL